MSSSDNSTVSVRPPLYATHSWVINLARQRIGYDTYEMPDDGTDDDGTDDDEPDYRNGTGEYSNRRTSHPVGNLVDYDPNRALRSQHTIAEVLQATVAETEVGYYDDLDSTPELSNNVTSSPCSGYVPADSLEGEPTLDYFGNVLHVNAPSMTNDGFDAASDAVADSPSPFLAAGTRQQPPSSSPAANTVINTRPEEFRESSTPARNFSRPYNAPSSRFLTVPAPAYTAPARERARQGKCPHPLPHTHACAVNHRYTFFQPLPQSPIERLASPMPRLRGEPPYPVSPDREVPPTLAGRRSASPVTASAGWGVGDDIPRLDGWRPPTPVEVVRPIPLRPAPRKPRGSSFAGRRRARGEFSLLTIDEDVDEDIDIDVSRLRMFD